MLQTGEYDYAWNLLVEDEVLRRMESGGKGRVVVTPGGDKSTMVALDKKTGKLYGIDGGLDYRRRSGPEDYEDISIIWEPNMPHDTLRDYLKWASYGKNGKGPVRYILLKDLDTDHINNILDTQRDLDAFYAKAFFAELDFRGVTQEQ